MDTWKFRKRLAAPDFLTARFALPKMRVDGKKNTSNAAALEIVALEKRRVCVIIKINYQ